MQSCKCADFLPHWQCQKDQIQSGDTEFFLQECVFVAAAAKRVLYIMRMLEKMLQSHNKGCVRNHSLIHYFLLAIEFYIEDYVVSSSVN